MAARPRLISLYTGAGGLDLGFEAAGFSVACAIEMDPDSTATLCAQERPWPLVARDIHEVYSADILEAGSLNEGEAAALIGGPPCQPFSKAGYWATGDTRRLDDPRSDTLEAYLRVLRDTLPKTFLLENVEGFAFKDKSEGLELLRRVIDTINGERGVDYNLAIAKLNAADYGVPQLRSRVFIVGSRAGTDFKFPASTHAPAGESTLLGLKPYATAWDAIGEYESDVALELALRGKWAGLVPSIPEGNNYLWHTSRGGGKPLFGWRRRYWSFLLKLAKGLPSWTIQAQPGPATGPFHWKNRRLSSKELKRLQTFPDDHVVVGSLQAVQKQLGNAVPSALAEILARSMRRQLLGHKTRLRSTLLPARREPVPEPEPVEDVPGRYLKLAGEHKAHPGTGGGFRASAR